MRLSTKLDLRRLLGDLADTERRMDRIHDSYFNRFLAGETARIGQLAAPLAALKQMIQRARDTISNLR